MNKDFRYWGIQLSNLNSGIGKELKIQFFWCVALHFTVENFFSKNGIGTKMNFPSGSEFGYRAAKGTVAKTIEPASINFIFQSVSTSGPTAARSATE